MHAHSVLLFLGLAWIASAAPLNINLGAYSPALVVGDGAIGFGAAGAEGGAAKAANPAAAAPAAQPVAAAGAAAPATNQAEAVGGAGQQTIASTQVR